MKFAPLTQQLFKSFSQVSDDVCGFFESELFSFFRLRVYRDDKLRGLCDILGDVEEAL